MIPLPDTHTQKKTKTKNTTQKDFTFEMFSDSLIAMKTFPNMFAKLTT